MLSLTELKPYWEFDTNPLAVLILTQKKGFVMALMKVCFTIFELFELSVPTNEMKVFSC